MATMSDIDTTAPLTGTIDGEGGVYLQLKGNDFECRKIAITWHMMRFANAQRAAKTNIPHGNDYTDNEDGLKKHVAGDVATGTVPCVACKKALDTRNEAGMELLAVMYDVVMVLLKPKERDRFETYMQTAELLPEELEDAIGETIAVIGGAAPKATTQSTSSASSASPAIEAEKSVAFSPEQVTVREIDPGASSSTA